MSKPTKHPRPEPVGEPVGRTPEEFARLAGISRALLYCLPADAKPASFKIGRRVIVIEDPARWVARLAARGSIETVSKSAKIAA